MKCAICGHEISKLEFESGVVSLFGETPAHVDCIEGWLSGAGSAEYENFEED